MFFFSFEIFQIINVSFHLFLWLIIHLTIHVYLNTHILFWCFPPLASRIALLVFSIKFFVNSFFNYCRYPSINSYKHSINFFLFFLTMLHIDFWVFILQRISSFFIFSVIAIFKALFQHFMFLKFSIFPFLN